VTFDAAVAFLRSATGARALRGVPIPAKLEIYALYKVGTAGACATPAPSMLDMEARAKWEAWVALGGLEPALARTRYVGKVNTLQPDWRNSAAAAALLNPPAAGSNPLTAYSSADAARAAGEEEGEEEEEEDAPRAGGGGGGGGGGPGAVITSRPMGTMLGDAGAPPASDLAASLEAACAAGDEDALAAALAAPGGVAAAIATVNDAGETLLHIAADGGHAGVIRALLAAGVPRDATVPDSGDTALDYATALGHSDAIAALTAS